MEKTLFQGTFFLKITFLTADEKLLDLFYMTFLVQAINKTQIYFGLIRKIKKHPKARTIYFKLQFIALTHVTTIFVITFYYRVRQS